MSIGGEYSPDLLQLKHWEQLAAECSVRMSYLKKVILKMTELLLVHLESSKEAFESTYESCEALQRVEKVIRKQCQQIGRHLAFTG